MKRSGNTVLITGGGSGIGLALARVLLDAGNVVIICGRDQRKLDAAAAQLPGIVTIRTDVADAQQRIALAERIAGEYGGLNVLVNNAGSIHVSDPSQPQFLADLEDETATNFVAPVSLTALLLPVLRRQAEATIVNVTTGYVFVPGARTSAYSATKTALHTMTRTLRFQLRRSNVRVVEVMPPPIKSAMSDHYIGSKGSPESAAAAIYNGLVRNHDEIVFGVSKAAQIVGRMFPSLLFRFANESEERAAATLAGADRS